ncbi:MAG TPA: hypothetical protein VJ302_21100, partial [Blastocatellia bacterium]|nr:hypothetical protein [Blastocatellia bacterium]
MPFVKPRYPRSLVISGGLFLVFCLSCFDDLRLVSRAQTRAPAPSDEPSLRAAVENYFAAYGRKDLARVVAFWSEKSPNLAAYRQSLPQQFTND